MKCRTRYRGRCNSFDIQRDRVGLYGHLSPRLGDYGEEDKVVEIRKRDHRLDGNIPAQRVSRVQL